MNMPISTTMPKLAIAPDEPRDRRYEAIAGAMNLLRKDFSPLRLADVRSNRKSAEVVAARLACFRLLRDRGLSFPAIGKVMAKNHSTVLKALLRPVPVSPF